MNLKSCAMVVSFGAVTVLCAGPASSADKAATAPAAPPKEASAQTAQVLTKLHQSNQMEIAAGKLAQEKGQSKDVKSFGKTLVTDHSAADKKVMALAKEEKIDLPAEVPVPAEKMDMLKGKSGADFDKMFASHMLEDHKKDIAEAKAARDSTTDAKLKALLTSTIPVLEKHEQIAQKLVDKLGPSASADGERAVPTAAK
jgi:putative membrane protein